MKKMAAGAFKVHCLAVMDEVQSKRQTVLITKRGKPVAKLVPVEKETDDFYNFHEGQGIHRWRRRRSRVHPRRMG
jgi:prevent-host-death family protein